MKSMEVAADAGGYILEHVEGLRVDVHNPQVRVFLEIREQAYVYVDIIKGQGGMPLGSNGKAALLLSGGIDSPGGRVYGGKTRRPDRGGTLS